MINDKKRRSVAALMREIMRGDPHGWLDVMVGKAVVDVMGQGVTIGETVADLIDRPTCHLVEDENGYTACSECGCTALCMLDASYCPGCGAMVVRDGD